MKPALFCVWNLPQRQKSIQFESVVSSGSRMLGFCGVYWSKNAGVFCLAWRGGSKQGRRWGWAKSLHDSRQVEWHLVSPSSYGQPVSSFVCLLFACNFLFLLSSSPLSYFLYVEVRLSSWNIGYTRVLVACLSFHGNGTSPRGHNRQNTVVEQRSQFSRLLTVAGGCTEAMWSLIVVEYTNRNRKHFFFSHRTRDVINVVTCLDMYKILFFMLSYIFFSIEDVLRQKCDLGCSGYQSAC